MTEGWVAASNKAEEKLLRRIARCKDELLRMTPGFLEDAAKHRKKLRQHRPKVAMGKGKFPKEKVAAARRDLTYNEKLLGRFAAKWELPHYPGLFHTDPSYMFEYPFSKAPNLEGTAMAIYEPVDMPLPVVFLMVDIRYPIPHMLNVIRERLRRGQAEWKSSGRPLWPKLRDEVQKYERMLKVHKMTEQQKKKNREIAAKLGISRGHVSTLRRTLKEVLATQEYRQIAPYLLPEWTEERIASYENVPTDLRELLCESVAFSNRRVREQQAKRRRKK